MLQVRPAEAKAAPAAREVLVRLSDPFWFTPAGCRPKWTTRLCMKGGPIAGAGLAEQAARVQCRYGAMREFVDIKLQDKGRGA